MTTEARREYMRRYREANRERLRDYQRERNKDPAIRARADETQQERMKEPAYRARRNEIVRNCRLRNPLRVRERTNAYRARHRDEINANQNRHRASHPEIRRAHTAVERAVALGELTPSPCEDCGAESRIEAHHEDYSKPLSVAWLCTRCHNLRHKTQEAP